MPARKPEVEVEPDPIGAGPTEIGQFVGFGAEATTRHDGEWTVDPDTGCVTGLLAPLAPVVEEAPAEEAPAPEATVEA